MVERPPSPPPAQSHSGANHFSQPFVGHRSGTDRTVTPSIQRGRRRTSQQSSICSTARRSAGPLAVAEPPDKLRARIGWRCVLPMIDRVADDRCGCFPQRRARIPTARIRRCWTTGLDGQHETSYAWPGASLRLQRWTFFSADKAKL